MDNHSLFLSLSPPGSLRAMKKKKPIFRDVSLEKEA